METSETVINKANTVNFKVILTSPSWQLNGVNTLSVNLVRGFRASGISAHILLSEPYLFEPSPMPLPSDITVEKLPVKKQDSWQTRWQAMICYLEQQAPCIYIPNYDWRHSCVSSQLSHRVGIVGIVHSDDPLYYEQVSRLGKYWNAIVSVSVPVGKKTAELCPNLSKRLVTIPNGVSVPYSLPQRSLDSKAPLKIVYAGRLVQYQKRVFDLPKIVKILLEMQIPVELTIIGDGIEAQQLRDECQTLIEQGAIRFLGTLPNEKVIEVFEQNDIFILTSEFEGMPVSLLEAMGRGCVPVVTDINSGTRELVQEGVNGYRLPVGEIRLFAARLATLHQDLNRRQEMSLNAYRTINEGGYKTEEMSEKYIDLFHRVMQEAESGAYRRPRGRILPPPELQVSWKSQLSAPVRTLGKRLLQLHSAVKSI